MKDIEMSEMAYIVIGDLAAVRIVNRILRDITQSNNPFIDKNEYIDVIILIEKWIAAMQNGIHIA